MRYPVINVAWIYGNGGAGSVQLWNANAGEAERYLLDKIEDGRRGNGINDAVLVGVLAACRADHTEWIRSYSVHPQTGALTLLLESTRA